MLRPAKSQLMLSRYGAESEDKTTSSRLGVARSDRVMTISNRNAFVAFRKRATHVKGKLGISEIGCFQQCRVNNRICSVLVLCVGAEEGRGESRICSIVSLKCREMQPGKSLPKKGRTFNPILKSVLCWSASKHLLKSTHTNINLLHK